MKKYLKIYIYSLVIIGFSSCSVQKFLPEGTFLLDEVKIESDTKEVEPSLLNTYVRQNPNAKWFNLVKVPMGTYCLSGKDSTRAFNRFLRKLGDAPVIHDPAITEKSKQEMEKAVRNMGYMRAVVHLDTLTRKHKLKVTYRIEAGKPYVVRQITYQIDDPVIRSLMEKDSLHSLIYRNMPFDVVTLDNERLRITKLLQNNGYYKFNKDFLIYQADTARNTYQVDLTMKLLPFQQRKEDTPSRHKQYTIRKVNFLTGDNPM